MSPAFEGIVGIFALGGMATVIGSVCVAALGYGLVNSPWCVYWSEIGIICFCSAFLGCFLHPQEKTTIFGESDEQASGQSAPAKAEESTP